MTKMQPSAADSSPATAVPDDGATAVVPDVATAMASTQLAWSEAEDGELDLPQSWRPAVRTAAGVFAACVAVAGAVTAVDRHWFTDLRDVAVTATSPTTSPAAPTPTATAEPVAATPAAVYPMGPAAEHLQTPELSTVDADAFYLNTLRSYGIIITNPYVAIGAAHTTCNYLRAGHSPIEAASVAMVNNATLTLDGAKGYVIAATAAYCPDVAPH